MICWSSNCSAIGIKVKLPIQITLFYGLLTMGFLPQLLAQPTKASNPWRPASKPSGLPQQAYWVTPQEFRPVTLDQETIRAQLGAAPRESDLLTGAAQATITLAMPDGSDQEFRVYESPVMAPELAAKYPEIKTYAGRGIDDPSATVRLDLTPAGFHAQILSPHGAVYIDPHLRDRSVYASYYKRNYRKLADEFLCETPTLGTTAATTTSGANLARSGSNLRTYRLACAADGEYTVFHGGTVPAGLAAVVTAVNRVNGVYEQELAIRMELVANNDLIIYTNPSTDPYSNTSGSTMLNQNQTELDSVIGSANYDIGHVFSTGGGGIAGLGVVCVNGSKARGVTGNGSPTGDSFWIDYVAHEMGHQFGANHTFNSSTSNCGGGNRNASTAYEQGSGSTIMAYAGICSSDDLQPHSDPYFHAASFDEILAFITGGSGSSCAVVTSTSNNAPSVSAGSNYMIPQNTPFTLTASGSDPDGDALTYCWEERDLGPSTTITTPDNGSSPLFRSLNPTSSPERTFPRLQELLNNTLPKGEVMPTTTRALNFRVTARDNRLGGGGVNTSDMQVSVVSSAGPFVVTSHNSTGTYSNLTTVTWNVANTTAAPINTTSVNILLSTNGGLTYPFTLAANTPNDGSEIVLLPNLNSSSARIKVAAAGNIFFDIGNTNFTVVPGIPLPAITLSGTSLISENCTTNNNAIDPGETVTVDFALQNIGSAATTNLVATLLPTNGVSSPSSPQVYGALAAQGGTQSQTFTFTANGACGDTIIPTLQLQDGASDLGIVAVPFNLGSFVSAATARTNAANIKVPDKGNKGKAAPFPSTISVTGVTGTVSKVTVTLAGFSHEWPGDVDVLLVDPNGQTLLLMSDAGESANPASGLTFTFDDTAPGFLSSSGPLASGTYKPTNYDNTDTFSAPAPGGPYGTSLSVFNGSNPNGTWSLFVEDDGTQDIGSISQGWRITITTSVPDCCSGATPFADLAVGLDLNPSFVNLGSNVSCTVNVTNFGPYTAEGVVLTNTLPWGVSITSAIATQGTTTNTSGIVQWILGSLANGAIASMTVETTATSSGNQTNTASLSATTTDLTPANNTASTVLYVNSPPTVSSIGNVTTNEDSSIGPIGFVIGDQETSGDSLSLQTESSNTNLLPLANILLSGTGTNRTITLTPALNQFGTSTVQVEVSDGMAIATTTFEATFLSVNDSPTLISPSSVLVTEGDLLAITNSASDVETPPQLLNFSLATAPTNASINPTNGIVLWPTTELDGPGTNVFAIVVTDDGTPPLATTQAVQVIVLETNAAPNLAGLANRTVHAGTLIQFTNVASDPDFPANTLTFTLLPGAPLEATLNPTNGGFTWLTTDDDVGTTNFISFQVSDDGSPSLSASNSFTAVVASRPVIYSIETSNSTLTLTWSAIDGQGYRLQTNSQLMTPAWGDIDFDVFGIGTTAKSTGILDQAEQYYRVRVLP